MKPFVVFGLFFSFAIMPVFSADNSPPSKTSASPSAAPAPKKSVVVTRPQKSVGHPVIVAGKPRLNPDLNARRYYPPGFQSAPKPPLAMNTSKTPQSYRPGQRSPAPVIASPSKANGSKSSNAANSSGNRPRIDANRNSYAEAVRRCRNDRHDHTWWKRHCSNIVFVNTGYYYLDASYWYPAYGYDPGYTYDYNGPIYTYGNLLPDQVIANVQGALREIGYYVGAITGSLGPATRAALANFQRDYGLVITAAVDEATVQSLGLM